MRRKETWATTGPRIVVRFFGGFDMKGVTPGGDDWVQAAYSNGVSMGGELKAADAGRSPDFRRMGDQGSGERASGPHTDREGVVEDGKSQEKVYDAVWSAGRAKDRPRENSRPWATRWI